METKKFFQKQVGCKHLFMSSTFKNFIEKYSENFVDIDISKVQLPKYYEHPESRFDQDFKEILKKFGESKIVEKPKKILKEILSILTSEKENFFKDNFFNNWYYLDNKNIIRLISLYWSKDPNEDGYQWFLEEGISDEEGGFYPARCMFKKE